MSGGFFRGTSADQDTRFSNKQAKLLKSQKFAPELEHLVDMTKVKMDVMRPWIAKRATELVGIEDEVLINFIYGLLEGKDVNGKEIQIQLTGFMERNTGKFMKELWSLLLSAQSSASGVPQQFLDAKEEETRKKKVEADRIINEIQRRKDREYQELEQEKRKAASDVSISRDKYAGLGPSSEHHTKLSPTPSPEKEHYIDKNGPRGRIRASRSPHSHSHSPPPRGRRSRSISRSFSNSRSYSGEKSRPSPEHRGRSMSSEREHMSPIKRSTTPRRKHSPQRSFSPPRRRRRSVSRSRRRSPSPIRHRRHSPLRRRSRSPVRRGSRSPMRRRSRSPMRRRSRSPMWRRSRSPMWRRSRSPVRRRSPSPRRRAPYGTRHRSPSPYKRQSRHSPSSPRRGSPTVRRPVSGRMVSRSPVRRSRSPIQRRSPSLSDLVSDSPAHQRSLSPVKRRSPKRERMSPVDSPPERMRSRSPKRRNLNERNEKIIQTRSPSPSRKMREHKLHDDTCQRSPDVRDANSSRQHGEKKLRSDDARRSSNGSGSWKRNEALKSEKAAGGANDIKDFDNSQRSPVTHTKSHLVNKNDIESYGLEGPKTNYENSVNPPIASNTLNEPSKEEEETENIGGSGCEESEKQRCRAKEKRKHKKRSARHNSSSSSDGSSYDSDVDEKKEAKRRKREEKRLKKEEKRKQRREERHRRREERRTMKQKLKSYDDVISGEVDNTTNGGHSSEDTNTAKKLEIELREKALESLRAKRGIGH
ncbi:unnamed protein product [Cuscuta campestris]|uniref:PWI domain-containing protein n=1 Tax=Cuscuta campestris TaxID=132261 RepID=A0A484NEC8_9ASTE|nr:unnamed protein product [Cuscuta campestris]